MSFTVLIDKFEGPLDLMLHLIKEKQLDLFTFDISFLADQYLKYLNEMTDLKLEVESEYLLELAILVEYKSRKILPKDESIIDSEYEVDPAERLRKRLIEYQQFKEISTNLQQLNQDRHLQVTRPISIMAEDFAKNIDENQKIEGNAYELVKALSKCLRRAQLLKPIETKYTKKEVSIDDRILHIKSLFIKLPSVFTFNDLIQDCSEYQEAIVTFLAVLELSKLHVINFTVNETDDIFFKKGELNE